MSDGKETGVLSLQLTVQTREGQGQVRTSFADVKLRNNATKRMYPDGVELQQEVEVLKSDSPEFVEGQKMVLAVTQGHPIQVVDIQKVRAYVVDVLSVEKEGLLCVVGAEETTVMVKPTSTVGSLIVSDGDVFQTRIDTWEKKLGHTGTQKITAPSVRGQHYTGAGKK